MNATARQLPLPLPVRAAQGEADFLVTESNREAIVWLDSWPDWPGQGLVLHGPKASGKSHLLAIWRQRAGADRLNGKRLTREQALSVSGPVAVDDADRCPDAQALFHLINQVRAAGGSLLLTAARPAPLWNVTLPDLASRLKALPGAGLHAPDDMLLTGLANKLFQDRQMLVPDKVIAFMVIRLERSCAAIAEAVDQLDRAALAARSPITVPFAKTVLNLSDD